MAGIPHITTVGKVEVHGKTQAVQEPAVDAQEPEVKFDPWAEQLVQSVERYIAAAQVATARAQVRAQIETQKRIAREADQSEISVILGTNPQHVRDLKPGLLDSAKGKQIFENNKMLVLNGGRMNLFEIAGPKTVSDYSEKALERFINERNNLASIAFHYSRVAKPLAVYMSKFGEVEFDKITDKATFEDCSIGHDSISNVVRDATGVAFDFIQERDSQKNLKYDEEGRPIGKLQKAYTEVTRNGKTEKVEVREVAKTKQEFLDEMYESYQVLQQAAKKLGFTKLSDFEKNYIFLDSSLIFAEAMSGKVDVFDDDSYNAWKKSVATDPQYEKYRTAVTEGTVGIRSALVSIHGEKTVAEIEKHMYRKNKLGVVAKPISNTHFASNFEKSMLGYNSYAENGEPLTPSSNDVFIVSNTVTARLLDYGWNQSSFAGIIVQDNQFSHFNDRYIDNPKYKDNPKTEQRRIKDPNGIKLKAEWRQLAAKGPVTDKSATALAIEIAAGDRYKAYEARKQYYDTTAMFGKLLADSDSNARALDPSYTAGFSDRMWYYQNHARTRSETGLGGAWFTDSAKRNNAELNRHGISLQTATSTESLDAPIEVRMSDNQMMLSRHIKPNKHSKTGRWVDIATHTGAVLLPDVYTQLLDIAAEAQLGVQLTDKNKQHRNTLHKMSTDIILQKNDGDPTAEQQWKELTYAARHIQKPDFEHESNLVARTQIGDQLKEAFEATTSAAAESKKRVAQSTEQRQQKQRPKLTQKKSGAK